MKFYPGFPIRIEHMDRKDKKTCWFQCNDHLDKYLDRNKLKISDVLVEYEDPRLKPVEKPKKVSAPKPKKQTKQLFSSLEQFFDDKDNVAPVGKSTGRKGAQKGSRRRSSSNT